MDWSTALAMMLGILVFLMATGLPVAFAFLATNAVGAMFFLGGETGLVQLARNSMASVSSFTLLPIPFFVFMGELLFHTGVAFRAIDAVEKLIRRVPGRLSVVSILGGTVFSSLTGSTIANTALLGSVLLPDMKRRGYHPTMSMGPIMATGGIAMLIPPSALAVLLGSLAGSMGDPGSAVEMSISKLLVAGIIPGILLSVIFLGYVVLRCHLDPSLAPSYETEVLRGWARWRRFVIYVVPLFLIVAVVIGSILSGWATPTESAACGTAASFVAALAYRSVSWASLVKSVKETVKITTMILFIILGSQTFSQILAVSGASGGLLELMRGIDAAPLAVLLVMLAMLLFLGAFVDQVSMMLITLPFFIPLALELDINLLWFGVLMLLAMEISFTTPPFGLLLYVMKGVAPPGTSMRQIFAAAMPFIGLALMALGLLVAFPGLATWLPETLLD